VWSWLNDPERKPFHRDSLNLSARIEAKMRFLRFLRTSFAAFSIKSFHRTSSQRRRKSRQRPKDRTLTIARDQQYRRHWRHLTSAAYNPPASPFSQTSKASRKTHCQSEPHFHERTFPLCQSLNPAMVGLTNGVASLCGSTTNTRYTAIRQPRAARIDILASTSILITGKGRYQVWCERVDYPDITR